ncbi:MAG TPA: hypothetical protein VHY84_06405 [Bryobacteraceae bacterium]|jgi:hypothetical protein|nr:hypothetical protein [Bryobacteraceae bacterium]
MNRIFSALALASLMAVSAFGQYDRPYGDRDYARQDRGMFDKARMDLDRASAYPYASRSDRKRFDEARGKLFDFESRFDQGRYDKHQLNGAIDRIQHVVESNSLDPRERGSLSDDLRRMRDYREFRNHHGERDYEYGYR